MNTTPLLPVRSLIRESWQRYTQHWTYFIEVSAWLLLIPVLSFIAVFILTLPATHISLASIQWISLFSKLVEFVLATWISIRSIQLALAKDIQQEKRISHDLRDGWNLFLPIFWISILSAFAMLGGFIAFVLPGIWLTIGLMFSSILFIDRGIPGQQALVHSLALVKGRWWPVAGRLFAAFFLFGILIFVAQSIFSSIVALFIGSGTLHSINELTRASLFGTYSTAEGYRAEAVSHLLEMLPQALFTPLFVISNVFLYRSLQETKAE